MNRGEVALEPLPLDPYAALVGGQRVEHARAELARTGEALGDQAVVHVNSTAAGGGVAEMLHRLVAYERGAGLRSRWCVVGGDEVFFRITKRLHHRIHGAVGDGGELGPAEHQHFAATAARNLERLRDHVAPGDVVVLHDPQTAGLVAPLRQLGARVAWRCHIGADVQDDRTAEAWAFLDSYLVHADAVVFSRAAYVPARLAERASVIAPSIDPFSEKNRDLDPAVARAIVRRIGVTGPGAGSGEGDPGGNPDGRSHDDPHGDLARIGRPATIVRAGAPVPPTAPLVVQVSRWDPLKDMAGVMAAFDRLGAQHTDAHLALVGPTPNAVGDDPEGQAVFDRCLGLWRHLVPPVRSRVHLVSLPMDDIDENALMVNAIQRRADVVVQKSLAEGFGLTVTEAMWKARPVVASAVGGIRDQIVEGEHGWLVEDPTDLDGVAMALRRVLGDLRGAVAMGERARARVADRYLDDRQLVTSARLYRHMVS